MAEIITVAVCLLLNAWLAAYEMAFVSVPRSELRRLARNGVKEAQTLLSLRESPERTLSVLQIGISLVGALAAAVGGVGASETIVPFFMSKLGIGEVSAEILAITLIVLPLTYLSVVLGELVPKTLALRHPARTLLRGTRWINIADRVLAPVVDLLEGSTKVILKVFFRRASSTPPEQPAPTIELDTLSPTHRQYVVNLANIERKRVRDVLVPWTGVDHVKSADRMETVAEIVFRSGHTRLPVIDQVTVLGILHTKEFLALRDTGASDWLSIVRPALKIHRNESVLSVLRLMQDKKNHMAVVFSSEGERVGIVTFEDIIEEIVGDLYDEYDDGKIQKILAAKVKSKVVPKDPSS